MDTLFDKLTEYGSSDFYPYHMPGHKRQSLGRFPEQITKMDITEIADFDNLHQPEGIILKAQQAVAEAYGAEESFFLVGGSTCGILSAVSVAVSFGGHLLIARNCHKSVYHGAYLRQLRLSYVYPETDPVFDICEAVTPKQVEKALEADSSIQAVLIVSPTYEGRIADVKAIADVVHKRGIPLIVDEAHGAHLGFAEGFAVNSSRLGADLVINSVHKTLPAMTQTALLHCNGSLVDREKLKRFLHIYQSSSPSYIMMASIEQAVQIAVNEAWRFQLLKERWDKMLENLKSLQRLKIPVQRIACKMQDVGKLLISTKGTDLSGKQLADILRQEYHLETEMACETYVLAMFTIADTEEGYERITQALLQIDQKRMIEDCTLPNFLLQEARTGISFYKAWDMEKKSVLLETAEGRMAGEFINLYPPGTPIAVPGEMLCEEMLCRIRRCLEIGLEVQGVYKDEVSGQALIRCIKEQ